METTFKEGDIIIFWDQEYVVLENYGSSGKVKENCEKGEVINNFYWRYQGEVCTLKE